MSERYRSILPEKIAESIISDLGRVIVNLVEVDLMWSGVRDRQSVAQFN